MQHLIGWGGSGAGVSAP